MNQHKKVPHQYDSQQCALMEAKINIISRLLCVSFEQKPFTNKKLKVYAGSFKCGVNNTTIVNSSWKINTFLRAFTTRVELFEYEVGLLTL